MTTITTRNYAQPHWRPGHAVDVVNKASVPHFLNLIDIMAAWLGSQAKALEACGVSHGIVWKAGQDGSLTVPQARKILAGYKRVKESRKTTPASRT